MKTLFIDYINLARDYYQQIMNDYSTTVTNKQLYVTYIIGGQAGYLLIGFRMVVMNHLKKLLTFYWLIRLNFKTNNGFILIKKCYKTIR